MFTLRGPKPAPKNQSLFCPEPVGGKRAPTQNPEKNNFTQSTSKGQGADLKVSEAGTEKTDQAQRVLSIVPFKDGPSNQPT